MWMNYVLEHSLDHADSECVSQVGVDHEGAELSVTNKYTDAPF